MAKWYNRYGEEIDAYTFDKLREDPDQWIVGKTKTPEGEVSTVLLGLDHRFGNDKGPPIIFETLCFLNSGDEEGDSYCTWEEAEEGHWKWVEQLGGEIGTNTCAVCENNAQPSDYLCQEHRLTADSDPATM